MEGRLVIKNETKMCYDGQKQDASTFEEKIWSPMFVEELLQRGVSPSQKPVSPQFQSLQNLLLMNSMSIATKVYQVNWPTVTVTSMDASDIFQPTLSWNRQTTNDKGSADNCKVFLLVLVIFGTEHADSLYVFANLSVALLTMGCLFIKYSMWL